MANYKTVELSKLTLPKENGSVTSLQDMVVSAVQTAIATKGVSAGDALPPERHLAEHFGVSRTTIIRAFDRLQSLGVLRRVQGRGTFVANPDDRPAAIAFLSAAPAHPALFQSLVGMAGVVNEAGGYLRILGAFEGLGGEDALVARALQDGATGMIIYPKEDAAVSPVYMDLARKGFPLVAIDRQLAGLDIDSVTYGDAEAAAAVCASLLAHKAERIAVLTHHETKASSVQARIEGAFTAAERAGLDPDVSVSIWSDIYSDFHPSRPTAHSQIAFSQRLSKRMQDDPVDLFFAVNGDVAGQFISDITELGSSRTVRLGACSHRSLPALSGQQVVCAFERPEELGRRAAEILLERIRNPHGPRIRHSVQMALPTG